MRAYDCPQCGGAVNFQSSITVFATCPYCGNMVVRRDLDVESLGKQAALPPDLSPLQVGTTGVFDGEAFTLVGKIRVGYEEGNWNEWCADFGNGKWGWIAEAQGYYLASFELEVPTGFPGSKQMARTEESAGVGLVLRGPAIGRKSISSGEKVEVYGIEYTVRDVKETKVLGSEGELPFLATPGRSSISADLGASGRRFANVEYSEEGIRLFVGRYCQFEDLSFGNLRGVPGWTLERFEPIRNQSAALSCPQCGAAVELRAAGYAMSAVCTHCQSLLDTSNPILQFIKGAATAKLLEPRIPLGARGILDGVNYECIGCLKCVDGYGDSWLEHLLFNPFHGFRWMIYYRGHWSVVSVLPELLVFEETAPVFEGRRYALFSEGSTEVVDVVGEFYWKVRRHDRLETADFISPPYVLSYEKYPALNEYHWSRGRYLTGKEVYALFNLSGTPLEPGAVYLNQPNPYRQKIVAAVMPTALAIAAVTVIQLISLGEKQAVPVLAEKFEFVAANTNRTIISREFTINGAHDLPVTVELEAPVHNNWLETEMALVNVATKEVREVASEVSFYDGYDEGYWKEGSAKDEQVFAAVPPGKYVLRIEPTADTSIQTMPVSLSVTPGGSIWSTWFLAVAAILAYPVYLLVRRMAFEHSRWANSSTGAASGDDSSPSAFDSLISSETDDD